MIVRAFVLAAFDDAEQMAVAQRRGELDEVLEAGGIARALGRADRDVEFHKTALAVVKGEAGDLVGAAPDFHGGSVDILTNSVVAESHGGESEGERMNAEL